MKNLIKAVPLTSVTLLAIFCGACGSGDGHAPYRPTISQLSKDPLAVHKFHYSLNSGEDGADIEWVANNNVTANYVITACPAGNAEASNCYPIYEVDCVPTDPQHVDQRCHVKNYSSLDGITGPAHHKLVADQDTTIHFIKDRSFKSQINDGTILSIQANDGTRFGPAVTGIEVRDLPDHITFVKDARHHDEDHDFDLDHDDIDAEFGHRHRRVD